MTVRMTEADLRDLIKQDDLDPEARGAARERLRALARRPVQSLAVCDEASPLGQAMIKFREG